MGYSHPERPGYGQEAAVLIMSDEPSPCGHKPPEGYRELLGEELEKHMKQMEAEGYVTRQKYQITRNSGPSGHCHHIYVKEE